MSNPNLSPDQFPEERNPTAAKAGYCTDEWDRWQKGQCGTYATGLMQERPDLRLGGVDFNNDPGFDNPTHFVAHDDQHAYDSAGRHPLPYGGIRGEGRWLPDLGSPEDYGIPDDEAGPEGVEPNISAAREHARRNEIFSGRWPRR